MLLSSCICACCCGMTGVRPATASAAAAVADDDATVAAAPDDAIITSSSSDTTWPAPFPPSNGGWYDRERKMRPVALTKPHITFILLECGPLPPQSSMNLTDHTVYCVHPPGL
eukprot:COSAG01_NODE_8903_length_2621_cov_1.653450_5_plen_113_part_00